MKICPNCKSENLKVAFRCKYCNFIIGDRKKAIEAVENAKRSTTNKQHKDNAGASLYILGGFFTFIGLIVSIYVISEAPYFSLVSLIFHAPLLLGIVFFVLGAFSGKHPYWTTLIGTILYTLVALLILLTIGFSFWFFFLFIAFGSYLYVGLFKVKRNRKKIINADILDL
jgi:hypothetical protein